MMTQHNQEITQMSPDPFPLERAGSGHETTAASACLIPAFALPHE